MNKPICYTLAKLLKEKGFDEEAIVNVSHPSDQTRAYPKEYIKEGDYILAPTIADVVMWLYEKHNIWIVCFPTDGGWSFDIFIKTDCIKSESFINSPTEAYEAAIEYTLTKLI